MLRVRTQVGIAQPDGGRLSVDLSFETEDRALQILVEAKVGAAFHPITVDGVARIQPDAYLLLWARLPAGDEARIRRVGTLTLITPSAGDPSLVQDRVRRAQGLTWRDVIPLLRDKELRTRPERDTDAVIEDLADHLETMAPQPDASHPWTFRPVLEAAILDAHAALPWLALTSSRWSVAPHYAGVTLFRANHRAEFWLALTTEKSRYRPPEPVAAVQLCVMSPSVTRDRLAPGGFPHLRDASGADQPRSYLPAHEVPLEFDDAVRATSAWLIGQLESLADLEPLRSVFHGGRSARDALKT